MIRRLFLALLVACLALPAAAVPMGGQAMASVAHSVAAHEGQDHGDHHQHPQQHAAPHHCIGCAVPSPATHAPGKLVKHAAVPLSADVPAAMAGRQATPPLPPPRS